MKNDLIVNGDCVNFISKIEDDSIDLICIDPPYEINYNNLDWDKSDQLNWKFLFQEFKRVLSPRGNLIIFQGWSNVCETISEGKQLFLLKNWIIYDRIKGRGAKTNLVSTREDILWFTSSEEYTYNKIFSSILKKTKGMGEKNGSPYRAMSNIWSDISPIVPWSKDRVDHPTQKPISLLERIITIFSNEGDVVLDCFAGSGTTAIACENLNRQYIMIEKEKKYFDIMKDRVQMNHGRLA